MGRDIKLWWSASLNLCNGGDGSSSAAPVGQDVPVRITGNPPATYQVDYIPVDVGKSYLGPVSWRPTTFKWQQFSQSNRHSTIGTRQRSIMKRYHRRRTCSHTSRRRSPMMATLHDTPLSSADGGMMVGLWKLSSLDGCRPPWYRPLNSSLRVISTMLAAFL